MSRIYIFSAIVCLMLCSCGLHVPSKSLLRSDKTFSEPSAQEVGQLEEGRAEANIVGNIRCEIANGLYRASLVRHENKNNVGYLTTLWGTQVTLKLTWDEMSGVAPSLSFIHPRGNMQSVSIGPGGSATAHATRLETVTFLFENADLVKGVNDYLDNPENKERLLPDCTSRETGTMIESDLKIAEFIIDKATIASTGIASTEEASKPPFTTFQEDLTFVGAFSGNLTPTWKLTRFASNTSGSLLSASRTTTGDVLITLGALAKDKDGNLLHSLGEPSASQHTAVITGGAAASQQNSQSH